jgi:hypothetical protein
MEGVLWLDDGLEPRFDVIFVSLVLFDCHAMKFFGKLVFTLHNAQRIQ